MKITGPDHFGIWEVEGKGGDVTWCRWMAATAHIRWEDTKLGIYKAARLDYEMLIAAGGKIFTVRDANKRDLDYLILKESE